MRLSMMSYSMRRQDWGEPDFIRSLCEFTEEIGLKDIDFVRTCGRDPKEIRRIVDDHGLNVICHAFFVDLNFPVAAERKPGVDGARRGFETALILGANTVMLPFKKRDGMSREQNRRNVIQGLKEIMPVARELGVTVTTESFPGFGSPFITVPDFMEAIEEVPELKVTFDNGNVHIGGEDPADSFNKLKQYVVHAHFKDWALAEDGVRGLDGRRYKGALIGEGIVDQKACIKAMKRAGYEGCINIEYEGSEYSPDTAVKKAAEYLQALIDELVSDELWPTLRPSPSPCSL